MFKNLMILRAIPKGIIERGTKFSYSSETTSQIKSDASKEFQIHNDESKNNELLQQEKDKLYSVLDVELKGIDPAVLRSYSTFAATAANCLGIEMSKNYAERKPYHDRLTLLKSVHIYKKHRVQYEIRTYFHHMKFHKLTGSTLDTFLEYIERNLPAGVALKATKTEIQKIPEHLKKPSDV